jgi:hypothetical protein
VGGFVAIDQEVVAASDDGELIVRDAGERLECRTRGAAAIRAVDSPSKES